MTVLKISKFTRICMENHANVTGRPFLACNHMTRRPCWWCVGGQYNRTFSQRIYMKIGFSSQRKEMLLLLTLTHHQHCRRDVTCKPAIQMLLTFGGRCNRYFWDIRLKILRLPNFNMLFQLSVNKIFQKWIVFVFTESWWRDHCHAKGLLTLTPTLAAGQETERELASNLQLRLWNLNSTSNSLV